MGGDEGEPAQLFELGLDLFFRRHTLAHYLPLARLFAATGQHQGVDVKRPGNIVHGDIRHLAQEDSGDFALHAVAPGGAKAWDCH